MNVLFALMTALYRIIVIALLFGIFVFTHDLREVSDAQWVMLNSIDETQWEEEFGESSDLTFAKE